MISELLTKYTSLAVKASSTGGLLTTGTYYAVVCAQDASGGLSGPSQVVQGIIPAAVTTGAITITGLIWPSGTTGYKVFVGTSVMNLAAGAAFGIGTPATIEIDSRLPQYFGGVPDVNYSKMMILARRCTLSGIAEYPIVSVTGTGFTVLNFNASLAWTVNQWAGRVISSFGQALGGTVLPDNYNIVSSTANTITIDRAVRGGTALGDWWVIRVKESSSTSTTVADAGLSMTTNSHVGEQVLVIAGTGAGQPPISISANDATSFTLARAWYTQPDATTVWIVTEPNIPYQYETETQHNQFSSANTPIATIAVDNYGGQNLFIQAITEDSTGNRSVAAYAPFREIHIYGAAGALGGFINQNGVNI